MSDNTNNVVNNNTSNAEANNDTNVEVTNVNDVEVKVEVTVVNEPEKKRERKTSIDLEIDEHEAKLAELRKKREDAGKTFLELHVTDLLNKLENMLDGQGLTTLNIAMICLQLMQMVERYPRLKGSQKKELVTHVLRHYLEKHDGDLLLLDFLDGFIDTSVQLDRGELVIKADLAEAAACCCGLLALGAKRSD